MFTCSYVDRGRTNHTRSTNTGQERPDSRIAPIGTLRLVLLALLGYEEWCELLASVCIVSACLAKSDN